MAYLILGVLCWGVIFAVLYSLRLKSRLHTLSIETMAVPEKALSVAVLLGIIMICILPMGLCPVWNGDIPEHRNQYEVLTESILQGHLYMDYEVDPKLLAMDNPYDRDMRDELGVDYHWDHAFYQGHYYMYFGVVPVFLLFLPYRVITGESLTTYHATQIFVAVFIIGIFALFYLLAKKFFPRISLALYLMLSAAFAMASIWYSIAAPALYATAITAGLCMEIWSLYFFFKSVWDGEDDRKCIRYAFLGSILGALAFGCRPPVALANLLAVPLLIQYLHSRKCNRKLAGRLLFAALPYVVVGGLLMAYNYARFDNPFEFGQAYQLTTNDQTAYGFGFSKSLLFEMINGVFTSFISYAPLDEAFPYLSHNGVLINFPVFFCGFFGLAQEKVRRKLKSQGLWNFTIVLTVLPFLITVIEILWSPIVNERYHMDIYWLMGLLCFLVMGTAYESASVKFRRRLSWGLSYGALGTMFVCFLLWAVPRDSNLTSYYPWVLEDIKQVIRLGR